MKRALCKLASIAVLCIATATGVHASTDANSLIVPGKSVGRIELGMPVSKAKEILGKPTSEEKDVITFEKKGTTLLVKNGKVAEIKFESGKLATKDGISLKTYEDDAQYKNFSHWKMPWRFMNVKHNLKAGGLTFFSTNADSGDEDYPPCNYGVVYTGKQPELGLSTDEPNGGWEAWDGNGETLFERKK